MSRKMFLYVIASLIVVAVLLAGGYALYRLGYAHGTEGTRAITIDRHWMPEFNRRMVPSHWYWRDYVGFPFAFIIPRIFSGLIFVAFVALAVYGGIKLFFPGSRNQQEVHELQSLQTGSPGEESISEE